LGGAIRVRRLAPAAGTEETTSGSSLVRSVRSMTAISSLGANESNGGLNTLAASSWHTGQGHCGAAVPIG